VYRLTEAFIVEQAITPVQIDQVRRLLREYEDSLPFDLCFQSFQQELAELPGKYAPACGRLLLATVLVKPAGCFAMRSLGVGIGEMKRLYVRPEFRGTGLGRTLVSRLLAEARAIGYRSMRLDTVEPAMQRAVALYRKLGFKEALAYCENPAEGVLYMELTL
jgi:ribosomal protein S18 acetylase RimI-like enzyme